MQTKRFSELSREGQTLIRLCQRVNYGSILNVQVTDGDVRFDAAPEVVFDVKLDGDIAQRPELDLSDFVLPADSCRLFVEIDFLKNGIIEKIVVHDGIPRRVVLRGSFSGVCI